MKYNNLYVIFTWHLVSEVGLVGGETDYTLQVGAALELTCFVVLQSDDDVSDVDVNIEWLTIDAGNNKNKRHLRNEPRC